ncbi:MAG: ATP phosphoribosyltransferase [Clostridia bacterium]|nr:ATP phosphoribosyltransferase [Clostridia bacterium]
MLETLGYGCPGLTDGSRKLIFEDDGGITRYFWVKPSDVDIYVERGAADIGVVGRDILLEHNPDVYELLDLGFGKCRMCVAGMAGYEANPNRTLRVATKFPNIARAYYAAKSREIEIIKLSGSIELAPILGMSDVIVDIVETGSTLKENNLEVKETVCDISARLIVNKAAYRFKNDEVRELVEKINTVYKNKVEK